MERIVIEVDDATAKKWQDTSPEIKRELGKNFQSLIEKISYESFLDKASDEAARNGLTEEILQQLLNEE